MTTTEYLQREIRRTELSIRSAERKPNTPAEELRGPHEKLEHLQDALAAVEEHWQRVHSERGRTAGKQLTVEQLRGMDKPTPVWMEADKKTIEGWGGYERGKRTMTLEQCVDKFLRTAQENPGLPVYCWVDGEVVCGDEYGRWLGEIGDCRVANVALYNGEWYENQDDLIDAYYNQHDEEYEGWDGVKVDYDIIRRTEHLWHKVILLNVDLPDSTCKGDDEA